MKVKIKKLHPDVIIPKQMSNDASCIDVIATEVQVNNNLATVKLGFATEISQGYKGCIVPRSSFTQKGWLMQNSPAQIDSDYRGEWIIKYEAIPNDIEQTGGDYGSSIYYKLLYPEFPYKVGDRVAQIYFEKVVNFEFEEAEELSITERNEGGFGSTGK